MASARSTVSIARTTPAQKPRGEHNSTFRGGFCKGGFCKGGVCKGGVCKGGLWESVVMDVTSGLSAEDVVAYADACQAWQRPKGKSFIAASQIDRGKGLSRSQGTR